MVEYKETLKALPKWLAYAILPCIIGVLVLTGGLTISIKWMMSGIAGPIIGIIVMIIGALIMILGMVAAVFKVLLDKIGLNQE